MICLPSGLADTGDVLVTRKKVGGGTSLKEKHVDDIGFLFVRLRKRFLSLESC